MNSQFKEFFGLSKKFEEIKINNDKALKSKIRNKKFVGLFIIVGSMVFYMTSILDAFKNRKKIMFNLSFRKDLFLFKIKPNKQNVYNYLIESTNDPKVF